ncbi:MAG: S9 family peptidase [Bacteroidota bacterium]
MQIRRLYILVFLLCVAPLGSAPLHTAAAQSIPALTLEDIHSSGKFASASFRGGRWANEGPVIRFIERDADTGATHLMSFNLEDEQREVLIDGAKLQAEDVDRLISIEGYTYSADGEKVLLYTDSERVWRANTKGYYYVYDLKTHNLSPISSRDEGYQMFAKLSPDGNHVAFVRNRNLFLVDLRTMQETQLTDDGDDGKIINGTSDWVYEEEFRLRDGWSWSPDGKYIAFYKFDEAATRDFFMTDLLKQYPEEERFRYPKAGEDNSEVKIGLVTAATGDIRYFDTNTWFAGGDTHEYIPQMGWTPSIDGTSYVWMIRLNRDQNDLDLIYGDPETATAEVVLEEQEPTWIDVNSGKITYLADNKHFTWMSETDGYRHIYLYKNSGELVRQVTSGAWEVASVAGIDEEKGRIYFTGTIESPLERQLYATYYKGRRSKQAPMRISQGAGMHRIDLSKDARYYIDNYSNVETPSVVTLHNIKGDVIRTLESNEQLINTLGSYALVPPEFTKVPGADGSELNAYLIKPRNFDPAATYPVLMYVYGGPGSQTVTNSWGGSRFLWHTMLANELNMIVASVDNRGTGARGKAFKSGTYKQLGQIEAADQVAAAQYLGSLPYVDEDRIGIWGWSYGGYMTLMSMMAGEGAETFKFGASVAPVTDWGLYDTIYTERYMSTPQSNPDGYKLGAPLNYAANLGDHQRLIIVHGDFDDNVHFQNAAQMANELQAANKQFEFMMYPGRNHGIYGGKTRLHLHTMMTRFIREALNDPVVGLPEID